MLKSLTLAASILLALIALMPQRAHADPLLPHQVAMPPVPADSSAAIASLPQRRATVINYEACSQELKLFYDLTGTGMAATGEDALTILLAKMKWALAPLNTGGNGNGNGNGPWPPRIVPQEGVPPCTYTKRIAQADLPDETGLDSSDPRLAALWNDLSMEPPGAAAGAPMGSATSKQIVAAYGNLAGGNAEFCANTVSSVPDPTQTGSIDLTYTVYAGCMAQQLNVYLQAMQVNGQPGTDGLPCLSASNAINEAVLLLAVLAEPWKAGDNWSSFLGGWIEKGDWDVTVRDLTRIRYMDRLSPVTRVLLPDTQDHIDEKLLTISGAVGPDRYPVLSCGDTEQTTGSAEDRADGSSWLSKAVGDLGDLGSWLLSHLFWLLALFAVAAAVAAAAAALGGILGAALSVAAAAVAVVAVVVTVLQVTLPETENHRLMIETSRYLHNQMDIADLQGEGVDPEGLPGEQQGVADWLSAKVQTFITTDFSEYNARPYQRYANIALLNLYDYATDAAASTEAQIALDYAVTKFALGSSEGRRIVPFRRHLDAVKGQLEAGADLLDMVENSDFGVNLGVLYTGQVQHSPDQCKPGGVAVPCVTDGGIGSVVAAAISGYVPDQSAFDLAMDNTLSFQQSYYHSGPEMYSRGPGYLITAGGLHTPSANCLTVEGLVILRSLTCEHDAEVPTTAMFAGAATDDSLGMLEPSAPPPSYTFLQIDGHKEVVSSDEESFDDNVCVHGGFACGADVEIPADLYGCANFNGPPPAAGQIATWVFVDTQSCGPYASVKPRLYIAIYRVPCPSAADGCTDNLGFFEIVPAGGQSFSDFMNKTQQNNPATSLWPPDLSQPGVYQSQVSGTITFSRTGGSADAPGVISVAGTAAPGYAAWPLAQGDIVNGGNGKIVITEPGTTRKLTLDMTNPAAPARTVSGP
jgi:hypothetical protein